MTVEQYHRELERHAPMKRFNERWIADPGFRSALFADTAGTLAAYRMQCTPQDVAALVNGDSSELSPASRAMWRIVKAKSDYIRSFYGRECVPDDWRFRAWRERQIARQRLDLGPFPVNSNIHASLAIELTEGCSVGCWFCALSPGPLSGAFRYTGVDRDLWRDCLSVLAAKLGPAARTGFLYWASDPLDNADYIDLATAFHEVIGVFPPTTTALPLRDPAVTRRLLRVSRERGCWLNRFSVVSLKLLDRIHAEFTSDELAHVECLAVNKESAFVFGDAGRFRRFSARDPGLKDRQRRNLRWAPWYTGDSAYAETDDHPIASIGCVTGFLLNMVTRRVKLITPCRADEQWPDGNHVLADEPFDGACDLAAAIDGIVERHMSPVVRADDRPVLLPWLDCRETDDGIVLTGRFHQTAALETAAYASTWHALGRALRAGGRRADAIVATLAAADHPATLVEAMLDAVLRAGVLDETAPAQHVPRRASR